MIIVSDSIRLSMLSGWLYTGGESPRGGSLQLTSPFESFIYRGRRGGVAGVGYPPGAPPHRGAPSIPAIATYNIHM